MKILKEAWNVFKNVSPFIAIVLFVLFLRETQMRNEVVKTYEQNLIINKDSVEYYKTRYGQSVAKNKIYSVTETALRSQLWVKDDSIQDLIKKLRNVRETIQIETTYKMPKQEIKFDTPLAVQPFFRNFNKTNKWYSISGEVTEKGIQFHNVSMFNTQRIVRNLEDGVSVLRVTNSNPYIETNAIGGQVVEDPKKKWVIGAGGIINVFNVKQSGVGIFVGYKIFEF